MRMHAAWVLAALLQPLPPVPPIPPGLPGPAPVEVGPVFDPTDEEVLQTNMIATDAKGLLEFFRQRVPRPGDEERIKALIRQLGDDGFDRREEASLQIDGLGLRAKPFLVAALGDPDAEIAHRVRECLRQIEEGTAAAATGAAIRVLARLKPEGAAQALLDYLPSAGDETLAEQVRLSLADLAVRDGKADPALARALTDGTDARRAAAAFAFGRARAEDQLPAVRRLLQDTEPPLVRYHAALGLAAARDKTAVPALIDLLDQLPRLQASRAEELLYRLADDKAPPAPDSLDRAARGKYRDAWKAWWNEAGPKLDAGRLEDAARTVGFTLIVLLDQGRVVELDSADHPHFEINQLNFPLDAQLLPDGHVLVAEHNGNRVTERDAKNQIVKERQIEGPLSAQRLPNGDTFIATRTQLVEVKPDGKETVIERPNGEIIMKAEKLPNGDTALVTQLGPTRFVLLDPKGQERRSFNVDLRYSGGRIDVLPNGNVLVPEAGNNRVVELDSRGQIVWEAPAEQPIAAVRLANGDTLITSYSDHRAVEVDRDGKEVWSVHRDTRVTRAFRR